jgi:hypothetical protein
MGGMRWNGVALGGMGYSLGRGALIWEGLSVV